MPSGWYTKSWGLRVRGGNLPASGLTVPVVHFEGGVQRTLQQAWDQGKFLNPTAGTVAVTIAPIDTWHFKPGSYTFEIVASGALQETLGNFQLGNNACLILDGTGEAENTALTFVGDSNASGSGEGGFTFAEWEDYLYQPLSAPQTFFEDDPVLNSYRHSMNLLAARPLVDLACESGGGAGEIFSCDRLAAALHAFLVCPVDSGRDPTVAIVARPPDGTIDWEDGWRAHAHPAGGTMMWPGVWDGLQDQTDDMLVTRNNPAQVVRHEWGHSFGRMWDYYNLYPEGFCNEAGRCTNHPSLMCCTGKPYDTFRNKLLSRDKVAMAHFYNRVDCQVSNITLSLPFPNPNGGTSCEKILFYLDYASPNAKLCHVNFAVVNVLGQVVWTSSSFEPLPANPPSSAGGRVPYAMGYSSSPGGSEFGKPECINDPAKCSKAPGWNGTNDNGIQVASGTYWIYAYTSASVYRASAAFTWLNHLGTQGCVPPGATTNGFYDYDPKPISSREPAVKRLIVPGFAGAACVGVNYLRQDIGLSQATCAAYCAHLGHGCANTCTTNRGLPNWGVEAWVTTSACESYTASGGQVTCATDLAGFSSWGERKYRCCCV
jgi:hypothetical protein